MRSTPSLRSSRNVAFETVPRVPVSNSFKGVLLPEYLTTCYALKTGPTAECLIAKEPASA